MTITIHIPPPPLNAYIKCFWYSDGVVPTSSRLKILPMPSLHVLVNFGDAFQVYQPDQAKPFATCAQSWSVGLWNGYHLMDSPQDMQVFNVSFKPGGAYPFLRLPLSELQNQIVPLDAICGSITGEIAERLYATPTLPARFALLERLLLERLCETETLPELNLAQYAIGQIARRHGSLSIQALSDHIGISQKHLIAHFNRMVGGTPKMLARLYRFHHVLRTVNLNQHVDWMWVARQSGYYDQSHFNRDFEALTGHTPTDYLRLRSQVQAEAGQPDQHLSHLPTG